jgi:hypothetical protein
MSDQTLSGLVKAIQDRITQVKSTTGHRAQGHHVAPPHYLWLPIGGPIEAPRAGASRAPALLGRWRCRWEVRCWGTSMDQATWLVFALLTAAHAELCGRQYAVSDVRAHEQANTEAGFAWLVELDLFLDACSIDITAAAPVPTETETALVEEVEQKTATSTPGDGQLEGTES